MPVDFLSDEQLAAYSHIVGVPSRSELERYFFLDDADLKLVNNRRPDSHRLGFAIALGTVRFLGAFLPDPREVPTEVVEYVAEQLGIEDASCLAAYADRSMTPYEHTWKICQKYGYRELGEADEKSLRDFLAARAWASTEGPRALFDHSVAWLRERKILLPGVSRLTRLVTAVRAEASERLWRAMADRADDALHQRLRQLLEVEEGSRFSALERLRASPARLSGQEQERSLERLAEVRVIGAGAVAVSSVPPNKVVALARYGLGTKAPALRDLAEPRRSAVLLATVKKLEQEALDDALDLFDVLMATRLLARAKQESAHEQLQALPRFAAASAKLAAAVRVLFDAVNSPGELSLAEVWSRIEAVVTRDEVAAALAEVDELAPGPDEELDEAWRAELVKRYATVRPFLASLVEVVDFGAVGAGEEVLQAFRRLPELVGRKKVRPSEVASKLVTGTWRRLVFGRPGAGADVVDHRAYVFCVLEHLHRALRRRDVFAVGSDRWGDPRARLLSGDAWERAKPEVLSAFGLSEGPEPHLGEITARLDASYRGVASRLESNQALELTTDGEHLSLARLEAEPEPPSLVTLRATVAGMLPRVDLPELLLEVHAWTGYLDQFTHLSEAGARMDDLAVSVAAVLVAEACNVGLRPVLKAGVPALTRGRLSHVDQNYFRPETVGAANARLIEAQAEVAFARALGGGLVASVDGLRFVVPVTTVNAAPNPRYFGMRRGVTWLNAVNDQFAGIGAVVVPGTVRDSLYILDLLLNLEGGPRPEVVITDTASYTDMVFGLFAILGYQFAPRIRDITDTRFWRTDPGADYGALNALAANRVSLDRVRECWTDMLRVAGSLSTGAVRAYDLMRMMSRDGHPSRLGQAFAEYGRIPKTVHLLSFVDVDDSYRRRTSRQLTISEGRHQLGRKIFHGHRGQLRQAYREGQEDQLGALGLVLNAVVLWNTVYMDAALQQLRAAGQEVRDEDAARLSPLGFKHLNFLGRYSFTAPQKGPLRQLRDPGEPDDDEDE